MNKRIIEYCTQNVRDAIEASFMGADQIEFCAHLDEDGLTPELSDVEDLLSAIRIPVKVMVRSRPGDFFYIDEEIRTMEQQIKIFSTLPLKGLVIGALDKNAMPDRKALDRWSIACGCMPLCFHKAIDQCRDWEKALEVLSEYSVIDSILTSGQANTAEEGLNTLCAMHEKFSSRFQIIAAGSITVQNIEQLSLKWSGYAFHGRRIVGKYH